MYCQIIVINQKKLLMLYFAYGSNMDEQRVKAANRCPNARFIFNALLPGYRLGFSHGDEPGSCAADAIPEPNSALWGVVYDITESDRRQLDAREGIATRTYRPKEVLVHPHGDTEQRVMVLTYAAHDPRGSEQLPTQEYLNHLLRGARQKSLPAEYVAQLEGLLSRGR